MYLWQMSVLASYVDTFSKNSKITFPSFTINLRHALHLLPPFTPLSCSILILPFVASIYNTVLNLFPEDINNFTGSSTFLEHLAQCYLNYHLISSSVSLRTQGFFYSNTLVFVFCLQCLGISQFCSFLQN